MFAMMDGFSIEDLVVNGVRSRKKNSELPNCPVCSCTIRHNELEAHLAVEFDRLGKLSTGSKRKISGSSVTTFTRIQATPGPSNDSMEEQVDVTGCTGGDVFQRVKANRMRRLRSRSRRSPQPTSECPMCGVRMPQSRLVRHAARCLRRSGVPVDGGEYVPDTSSDEEGSIDVENDAGGESTSGFGAEYSWCGEWRVRASALASPDALHATPVRRASTDTQLVVDGDEDAELYGPPQYSPSRIDGVDGPPTHDGDAETTGVHMSDGRPVIADQGPLLDKEADKRPSKRLNGIVEASLETRIQALTARIRELESQQSLGNSVTCLICLGPYSSPTVSIQCWHVYCESCWLESLRAKKLCPQCNAITTATHLRRIYM